MKTVRLVSCLVLTVMSCLLAAQPSAGGRRAFIDSLRPSADKWSEPTGPYAVTMEVYESLPDYTVYRPSETSDIGNNSLPVVIMMGPGCNQDGDSFRPFWTEVASYGYFVIAVGPPLPSGYMPPIFFLGTEDVKTALDWVCSTALSSEYEIFSKIDTERISLMGQSCGAVQCLRLAAEDKRVSNMVFWNSAALLMGNIDRDAPHVFGEGRDIYGLKDIKRLHLSLNMPVAYFVGDTDMAREHALEDFYDSNSPTVFAVREIPGDSHAGTFREKNGGAFAFAAVSWLEWQFRGDKQSKSVFTGKTPALTSDSKWVELKTKNIK